MMMKRYFIFLITALLSMMFASCQEELVYKAGDPDAEECAGVFFPAQKGAGEIQIEPKDYKVLTYTVRRTDTKGELIVRPTLKDTSNLFSVSEIEFADGQPVSQVSVYFDSIKEGVTYDCTILIDDDRYASKYSQNSVSLNFNVTLVQWNDLVGRNGEKTGKYRDAIFQDWFTIGNKNCERDVYIQERNDMPGYYRIADLYDPVFVSEIFGSNLSGNFRDKSTHYTYINATDPDKVWIPTFKTGLVLHSDYGEVSIGSYVEENSEDGSINSIYGRLEDGVITFPSGSFDMSFELMEGQFTANNSGNLRLILPGYSAKDYEVELSVGVSDEEGKLPVDIDFGNDIAQVWIAAYEGSITETEAEAEAEKIASGNVAEGVEVIKVEKKSSLEFTFDKSGMYSIVAVGLDNSGSIREQSNASFGYLAAGDDRKQVVLTCGLTASNKYASEGMTDKNSLELYINGKDIQRLHAGIYEADDFDRDPESVWAEVRESQFTKTYLDIVNGEGLSLRQGFLTPGTEYILLVEAYNGYRVQQYEVRKSTEGKWDARLANYRQSDIDPDLVPANYDGYMGDFRYYAIEHNMYSREYLGDVKITVGTADTDDYRFLAISGLFPYARKQFNMKDDTMNFVYLDGFLYNYDQAFEYFVHEGQFFYPLVLMYTEAGVGYQGRIGLMGGYVSEGIIAIVDSGYFADYNEVCTGFVVLAYQDQNHTISNGMIELVSDMLLVRPDIDDELIAANGELVSSDDEEEEDDELETVTSAQIDHFSSMLRRGPVNCVESFDGYLKGISERVRAENDRRNLLDMNNLQTTSSFELNAASFQMNVR